MKRYIDADKAIDAVHGEFDECLVWDESGIHTADEVERILDNLPPAPVREVKRGRWIDNGNGTWSCSLCQSWIPDEQHYYANYCLRCGAEMREEAE